jgi:hypothetical protein
MLAAKGTYSAVKSTKKHEEKKRRQGMGNGSRYG